MYNLYCLLLHIYSHIFHFSIVTVGKMVYAGKVGLLNALVRMVPGVVVHVLASWWLHISHAGKHIYSILDHIRDIQKIYIH